MPKPVSRLGRGLSSIIASANQPLSIPAGPAVPAPPAPPATAEGQAGNVRAIAVDRIVPNPKQPRTHFGEAQLAELAASIRVSGVLQPILVRPVAGDRFELVAGERRWRAARLAGLQAVPAIARETSDRESLEIALVENLQREDLGPLERAAAFHEYITTFQSSTDLLSRRLGESRANVVNYLRLLKLNEEIREMVRSGQLGMGHARALLSVEDPKRQLALARLTVRRNLSVRKVEELAKAAATPEEPKPIPTAVESDRHVADVERSLSKSLGLPVQLRPGRAKNSGTIMIRYKSLEEFDQIAERIGGQSALE